MVWSHLENLFETAYAADFLRSSYHQIRYHLVIRVEGFYSCFIKEKVHLERAKFSLIYCERVIRYKHLNPKLYVHMFRWKHTYDMTVILLKN